MECFNKPRYALLNYSNLEQLLLKPVKHEDYEEELKFVSELYKSDLYIEDLQAQLLTLSFQNNYLSQSMTLDYLQTLDKSAGNLYCKFVTVDKLLLVMPASNATSKRSFSALRRKRHT